MRTAVTTPWAGGQGGVAVGLPPALAAAPLCPARRTALRQKTSSRQSAGSWASLPWTFGVLSSWLGRMKEP